MPATEALVPPDTDTPATTPVLLQSIQLSNILSFGADTPELKLNALNVLIGANGSGKSNLIDCIALLRSTPGDMGKVIRDGGGVQEWIHKGNEKASTGIEAIIFNTDEDKSVRHTLVFYSESERFRLAAEVIVDNSKPSHSGEEVLYSTIGQSQSDGSFGNNITIPKETRVERDESALRVLRDPINRPELAYLADQYERIRIYREWQFGRKSLLRKPQAADMPLSRLEEDFSNLGLFLNRLCSDPKTKKTIVSKLRDVYDGADDIWFDIAHGFVQLNLVEGDHKIPASRLSDGTLHYLCLLAILCDPNPPPLICIEEPELGLHPDLLPGLADLLLDASTRTQLIVTTHSEIIVDVMTDTYESVLVCEKHNGQTHMERLQPRYIKMWLDKYRLGELWISGELGGKRW